MTAKKAISVSRGQETEGHDQGNVYMMKGSAWWCCQSGAIYWLTVVRGGNDINGVASPIAHPHKLIPLPSHTQTANNNTPPLATSFCTRRYIPGATGMIMIPTNQKKCTKEIKPHKSYDVRHQKHLSERCIRRTCVDCDYFGLPRAAVLFEGSSENGLLQSLAEFFQIPLLRHNAARCRFSCLAPNQKLLTLLVWYEFCFFPNFLRLLSITFRFLTRFFLFS